MDLSLKKTFTRERMYTWSIMYQSNNPIFFSYTTFVY